jgi:RecA-family ATPase
MGGEHNMNVEQDIPAKLAPPPTWLVDMANGNASKDRIREDANIIHKGTRNNTLYDTARALGRQGKSEQEILVEVTRINETRCHPRLALEEVIGIAESASKSKDRTPAPHAPSGITSPDYNSLREFRDANIPKTEEIIFGLGPGEVGVLVSVTNVGKTTLMLNMALSLAAGEAFVPLIPEGGKPRRVLYCDFETRSYKFLDYIERILPNLSNEALADDNFIPVVDHRIDDAPLNLSNTAHLEYVKTRALRHQVSLIIIDTMGAAFQLTDENSNTAVIKELIKPLIQLARQTNAAVLFSHHMGKPNEIASGGVAAYSGRGASCIGGHAHIGLRLTPDNKKGAGYVILECTKVKGEAFRPQLFHLNRNEAWFELQNEAPELTTPITVKEIADYIKSKGTVRRKQILTHFENRGTSAETIDRRLDDGVKSKMFYKPKGGQFSSTQGNSQPSKKED